MSRNFELLQQVGGMLELPVSPEDVRSLSISSGGNGTVHSCSVDVAGKVRDEIAKLVLNLFLLPGAQSRRQVIFAGAEAGAGSSWMCARVAEVLASQVHGSVCVVDCNLRRSRFASTICHGQPLWAVRRSASVGSFAPVCPPAIAEESVAFELRVEHRELGGKSGVGKSAPPPG